jgi:hypothetical protein
MDRLFIATALHSDSPPLEPSPAKKSSNPILRLMVLLSVGLHLFFVALLPKPKLQPTLESPHRVLQLRITPAVKTKVETVTEALVQESTAQPDDAQQQKLPPLEAKKIKALLSAPVISIGEALRQTLTQPSKLNHGIRCTPLQRRQRLINCDDADSEIGQFAESDLSRSLDASLAIAVPTSERSMALRSRLLLLQREQLEGAATSTGKSSEFLQAQVAQDLRQLRHQTDSLDRQRSSLDLLGITVDTYRASDSHTRNPSVFNQGRL